MFTRILKWIGVVLLLVLLAVAGLAAFAYYSTGQRMAKQYTVSVPPVDLPTDPARIEHGKYLVHTVSMCAECHGEDLGGKMMMDNFAMGHLAAVNLTTGRGGVGSMSNADMVRVLLHGVRPDGRSVVFMPSQDYHFSEADAADIIAYLRTLPPVDRALPAPSMGPMARILATVADFPLLPAEHIDHATAAFAGAVDTSTPEAAGSYLVSTAGCRGCHGQDFTGGGGPPPGAANITPVGLAGWTPEDFMRAIREHKRPNGTTIDEAMPRAYGALSDEDLRHIFAYLKTIPPKGQKTKNQMAAN